VTGSQHAPAEFDCKFVIGDWKVEQKDTSADPRDCYREQSERRDAKGALACSHRAHTSGDTLDQGPKVSAKAITDQQLPRQQQQGVPKPEIELARGAGREVAAKGDAEAG
jgi:hypothetical protein